MDPVLKLRALLHALQYPLLDSPDIGWLYRQFDQGEWGGMEEPVTLFDTASAIVRNAAKDATHA